MSTKKEEEKRAFEVISEMAQAFASPTRLRIIQLLVHSPRCVESIAMALEETVANTSQHLRRLYNAGVLTIKKDKNERVYALKNDHVLLFLEKLMELSWEQSPALKDVVGPSLVKSISSVRCEDLVREIKKGKAVLLDIRSDEESQQTPIPLALHIAFEKIEEQKQLLLKENIYYVVCRGPFCSTSKEGVILLTTLGFEAYNLHYPFSILRSLK